MAINVRDPLLLACYEALLVETLTKATATVATFGLGYTRTGALPSAIGAYVAGLCTKDGPTTRRDIPVATIGYAIGRVGISAVIPQDSPVTVDATGALIVATGTNYILGRALDSSTGTGTALVPHYICIKLT